MSKNTIIFIGHFLPGIKAGGPIQSIKNLIECYSNCSNFYVVCNKSDLGESEIYPGIIINKWNDIGICKVFYCDINLLSKKDIINLCKDMDSVISCGTYDKYSINLSILAKKNKIPPLYIASMGNFYPGALKIKSLKKDLFFAFSRLSSMYKNVTWLFTSTQELEYAKKKIIFKDNYLIASDIPRKPANVPIVENLNNPLKMIYLSRIAVNKNLLGTINVLKNIDFPVCFDIYGFIEDKIYWSKCLSSLESLPENITWRYCGEVNPKNVLDTFRSYDVFLFLTYGENFGHVIYESLISGCIPLLSNLTPWRFDGSCGYTFDLNDIESVLSTLRILNYDRKNLFNNRKKCQEYASQKYESIKKNNGYNSIF